MMVVVVKLAPVEFVAISEVAVGIVNVTVLANVPSTFIGVLTTIALVT